jgi:hypothetical protein
MWTDRPRAKEVAGTRRLARAQQLSWLTGQAWLGLIAFDLGLLCGFELIHEKLRACRVREHHRSKTPSTEDIIWAVDEACVWYVTRVACLQRSAVATWLLRRYGFRAELVIGYRPLPFESHAWVEVHGRVVNDRQQYQNVFTVLERL